MILRGLFRICTSWVSPQPGILLGVWSPGPMMWSPTSLPISGHVHGGLSLMWTFLSGCSCFYIYLFLFFFGPNFYIFVTDLLSMSHKRTKKKITLAVAVLLTKIVFVANVRNLTLLYPLSLSLSLSMCLHVAWKWINYFSVFWCVPEFIIDSQSEPMLQSWAQIFFFFAKLGITFCLIHVYVSKVTSQQLLIRLHPERG